MMHIRTRKTVRNHPNFKVKFIILNTKFETLLTISEILFRLLEISTDAKNDNVNQELQITVLKRWIQSNTILV